MKCKPLFVSVSTPVASLQVLLLIIISCCSCRKPAVQDKQVYDFSIDLSVVPADTILVTNRSLTVNNDEFFVNGKAYSGVICERFDNGGIKASIQVYKGKRYGASCSYYAAGKLRECRMFRNNLATGRHYGYWENGLMKFDYTYYENRKVGDMKQWFRSGKPYIFTHYVNDHEEGLQRGWRENGKLFANYVVKDGIAYGLQESALCYTLKDQQLKEQQQ